MFEAIVFDLDGTLVQTETLKAQSYAQAAVELGRGSLREQDVVNAYKEVAGLSRQEVAQYLLGRFNLEAAAGERMDAYYVRTAWQAFVQIRMRIYDAMLEDSLLIVKHRCPFSLDLLIWAREKKFKTGLATMSGCVQANRVLQILDVANDFDFIATRDDVNNGKPDPEIYRLMAHELCVEPAAGLVIEDSLAGIRAAVAAQMPCIAVPSDFTRKGVRSGDLLEDRWIVDNPAGLKKTVKEFMRSAR